MSEPALQPPANRCHHVDRLESERKQAEEQIRRRALTDLLTGLASYRCLLDTLESEIKRYGRNGRSFAVLLIDLDGLKKINDAHGHLVGSRALDRVANILRIHCREIDTAARYGGDEFVVVLPETGREAAWQVAQRISLLMTGISCEKAAGQGKAEDKKRDEQKVAIVSVPQFSSVAPNAFGDYRVWISRYHFNVSLFPASSKFAQASSFRLATHSSAGRLVSAFATSAAPLVGRDPV
jgi:diguanylate cyclase (GGDEF)-like protein